jgi:hypothetical protein
MKTRPLVVLLLCLLAAGCTSAFVYNRLDTLVAWYVEGLVTLSKPQRAQLRQWLGETLDWHRGSELERYSDFLKSLSAKATEAISRTELEHAEHQFRRFTADLAERSAPQAAELLLALDDRQLEELLSNLEKESEERLEEEVELIEDREWHARRSKQIAKQLKRWTGAVEIQQRDLIHNTAKQLQPSYPEWLASQRAWRAALREAMALRHEDPSLARREVMSLLKQPDRHWTEAYRDAHARNRELIVELLVQLGENLTQDQRLELQKELLKLADRLDSLANGGQAKK